MEKQPHNIGQPAYPENSVASDSRFECGALLRVTVPTQAQQQAVCRSQSWQLAHHRMTDIYRIVL